MRLLFLIIGFLVLIFIEILRVYFIMPFPGSQEVETIQIAYFIHNNVNYFRLIGLLLMAYPFAYFFNRRSRTIKITLSVIFGFYVIVFYMFNYRFLADQMFLQPKMRIFLDAQSSKVLPKQLVLGVTIGNESKAYPIEIIGYHHQVCDTVGGVPIIVTYCTVCRTGRVFSPMVDGKPETFRLVGMDHYNAMFEDSSTKSWWRQVNGEAIVGPRKGKMLDGIAAEQMSLAEWTIQHPSTRILQPDITFSEAYQSLKDYDEGKEKGRLEKRDSVSWKDKSWVIGIQIGMVAKAYDWNDLQRARTINDIVDGVPVLIAANPDSISFHSFSRVLDQDTLSFSLSGGDKNLMDTKTNSRWNWNGQCVSGVLQGKILMPIQTYQEYWHSWNTFRPQTTRYILQ